MLRDRDAIDSPEYRDSTGLSYTLPIHLHGLRLWQRYISPRCVVFLLAFCSAEPSNAESLLYRAYILAPAASASP